MGASFVLRVARHAQKNRLTAILALPPGGGLGGPERVKDGHFAKWPFLLSLVLAKMTVFAKKAIFAIFGGVSCYFLIKYRNAFSESL